MVLTAILTSMNVAEICGLQWKRVNLSDEWTTVDGEALPPLTLAVRRQWYRGEYGTLKKKSRKRNLPIPRSLVGLLVGLKQQAQFAGPDDPVFASRAGTPLDEHNIAARWLRPIGKKLAMPWLSWHVFRHTHATLGEQIGMALSDRQSQMGHGDIRMTLHYTHSDLERRRAVLDVMGEKLAEQQEATIQ
jgi:integrase